MSEKEDMSKDFIIPNDIGNKSIKRSCQVVMSKYIKEGCISKHGMLKMGNHSQKASWMSKFTLLKDIIRSIHRRKVFHELSAVKIPVASSGNH